MRHKRKILGFVLIIILISLMIYSSLENEKETYDIFYIFENHQKDDNKILFTGEITEINYSYGTIILRLSNPPYDQKKIKIEDLERHKYNPKKGDILEILGIKTEGKNITVVKILIFERWKHDLIYIRSLPAIPFALFLFFKTWRFNKKTYRFERRKQNA